LTAASNQKKNRMFQTELQIIKGAITVMETQLSSWLNAPFLFAEIIEALEEGAILLLLRQQPLLFVLVTENALFTYFIELSTDYPWLWEDIRKEEGITGWPRGDIGKAWNYFDTMIEEIKQHIHIFLGRDLRHTVVSYLFVEWKKFASLKCNG
jgi:hypothetical protein